MRNSYLTFLVLALLLPSPASAQSADWVPEWQCPESVTPLPDDLVAGWVAEANEELGDWLDDPTRRQLQIVVGEVVEDGPNGPCVRYSAFHPGEYDFYPASTVKPLAILAAIRELSEVDGWDLRTGLLIHPLLIRFDDMLEEDPSIEIGEEDEEVTLRGMAWWGVVRSSNPAYNHIYDLIGRHALTRHARDMGFESATLGHRLLAGMDPRTQDILPAVDIEIEGQWAPLHDERWLDETWTEVSPGREFGVAHIDEVDGQMVHEPMDFSARNRLSFMDMHRMVVAIARPDVAGEVHDLGVSSSHQRFLAEIMAERAEGDDEDEQDLYDRWYKPLFPGVLAAFQEDASAFRYTNKCGAAYGFHMDTVYVEHIRSGRSFFVTVSLSVNANETLNDDTYQYEAWSYPFFAWLGWTAAHHFFTLPEPADDAVMPWEVVESADTD